MRADRTTSLYDLKSRMARDYEGFMKTTDIVEKYKEEYFEITGKELTVSTAARNIPAYCSWEKLEKVNNYMSKEVGRLHDTGLNYKEIAQIIGISETKARYLHVSKVPPVRKPVEEPTPVTQKDIEDLRGEINEGDTVTTKIEITYRDKKGNERTKAIKSEVKIEVKSKYGVQTDKGFQRYADMVRYRRELCKETNTSTT